MTDAVCPSSSFFGNIKKKLSALLPDSIFGQILFVLVAGLALLQIANFLVVCGVQLEAARIGHVVSYRALFESIPADLRAETLNAAHGNPALGHSSERVTIVRTRPDWPAPGPILAKPLKALEEALAAGGASPEVLVRGEESDALFPLHAPPMEAAVALEDGTWLTILFPVEADDRLMVWSQRLFVFLEAIVLLVPLVYLLKRVTKPIDRLCSAAEAFGAAPQESPALPEEGPRELRSAANAFNRMREQIRGHLDERNRMIAAPAHNLRTPLTKLQLRLARVEPETLRNQLAETAKGHERDSDAGTRIRQESSHRRTDDEGRPPVLPAEPSGRLRGPRARRDLRMRFRTGSESPNGRSAGKTFVSQTLYGKPSHERLRLCRLGRDSADRGKRSARRDGVRSGPRDSGRTAREGI